MSTRRTGFLNTLSYIAIIAIGVAITLSMILHIANFNIKGIGTVINACEIVARWLAYIVVGCYSYVYARTRGRGWFIAWIIAIVLILVSEFYLGYNTFFK